MPGNQDSFFQAVLQALGAPITPDNMVALRAWNQAEGMEPQNFNPFATTQAAPGATDVNSVGVKQYPSFDEGVTATVQTLTNGYYAPIVAALRAGNNSIAVGQAIANSPWGTGGLVLSILNGGGPLSPSGPDSSTLPGRSAAAASATNAGVSLNPLDLFKQTTGAIVQPILSGAMRIVLTGVCVAGGVALIVLGVARMVQPAIETVEPAAKAAGAAAAL